jgi:hypothetical protein
MEFGRFNDINKEIKELMDKLLSGEAPAPEDVEGIAHMLNLASKAASAQKIEATLAVRVACSMLGIPEVGDHIKSAVLSLVNGEAVGLGVQIQDDDEWTPDRLPPEDAEKFETIMKHLLRGMGLIIEEDPDDPDHYKVIGIVGHENCGPDGCLHKKGGDVDVEAAVTAFRAELDQFEKTIQVEAKPSEPQKNFDLKDSGIAKWMPRSKE